MCTFLQALRTYCLKNNLTFRPIARGTVRSTRKVPTYDLETLDIKNHTDYNSVQKDVLSVCAWKDKTIFILSSADNPSDLESSVSRKFRNVEVLEYKGHMNRAYYADLLSFSKKWWLYLSRYALKSQMSSL